jgi:subfamily B ATP-binding cassette protein MsbA
MKHFHFLDGSWAKFFIAVIAGILAGIASGFGIPIFLKIVAEKVFSREYLPLCTVIAIAIAPVAVMALRACFSIVNAYYTGFCGQKILQGLRVMVFDKIQRLPVEYFKKTEPGELITRSLSDTSILQETMVYVSQEIIKQPATLLAAISSLIYLCHRQSDIATLLIFLGASAIAILPVKIIGKKMREKSMALQRLTENATTQLAHNLSAIQEIRAFAMEESEVLRYSAMCDGVMASAMKSLKYSVSLSPIIEVIASAGIGLAMFYSYHRHIGVDSFLALSGALYFSYDPIKKIADLNNRLQIGSASLSRIEDLLAIREIICDPLDPVPVGRLGGSIEFEGVCFSYGDGDRALVDVSMKFEPGRTYAIVGGSGAGKTTVANLIIRFYDVLGGAIKIDGTDLRRMRLADLRRNISYVPQSTTLVNGTIADNILWGNPGAEKEQVIHAAEQAYADVFISKLPDDYGTYVGEGGTMLSGGQRQRISIARAFLRDAPIIIFDEATSALDGDSEREVHCAIANLAKNKTAILISHRFTMMHFVDIVFVLRDGQVAEVGSPAELAMAEDSIYRRLHQLAIGGN